jgi:c-di-GMP-binding flagellar brake protein YcgR
VGIERRQFPRVEVEWPVTMLTSLGPIEGEVMNVSLGGAFIYCQEQPKANETFRMVIKVPHQRQFVRASARIARSNIYDPDDPETLPGIGVRFVEISEDDLQYIRDVVAKHQE